MPESAARPPAGSSVEIKRLRAGANELQQVIGLERRNFSKADSWVDILEREARRRNTVLLYAMLDGQVVGYICSTTNNAAVHMSKVAVDRKHRRQGIARALIQACLRLAVRERRVLCASLHVDPSNAAARTLYQSLGFATDAVLPDYYAPGRPAWKMLLPSAAFPP